MSGKFENWWYKLVGVDPKPFAATTKEWKVWHKQAKKTAPLSYYMFEDLGPDAIRFLMKPFKMVSEAGYYMNARFVSKSHMLPTHLKKGQYHEVSERMIHGLFGALVEYVEVECAAMYGEDYNSEADRKEYTWVRVHFDSIKRVFRNLTCNWLRFSHERDPERGLKYLDWEIGLANNDKEDCFYNSNNAQSEAAVEVKTLYLWWTQVRPARPDPHDVSGWYEICERRNSLREPEHFLDNLMIDRSVVSQEEIRASLDRTFEVEQAYELEDTQMMIRLSKIRNRMWT